MGDDVAVQAIDEQMAEEALEPIKVDHEELRTRRHPITTSEGLLDSIRR